MMPGLDGIPPRPVVRRIVLGNGDHMVTVEDHSLPLDQLVAVAHREMGWLRNGCPPDPSPEPPPAGPPPVPAGPLPPLIVDTRPGAAGETRHARHADDATITIPRYPTSQEQR